MIGLDFGLGDFTIKILVNVQARIFSAADFVDFNKPVTDQSTTIDTDSDLFADC